MIKRVLPLVALVLLANALALMMVVRNGSGSPTARVRLTERELRMASVDIDTTGVTLSLAWRDSLPLSDPMEPWLTPAKLESIGFDCSVDPHAPNAAKHYAFATQPPRATTVVLDSDAAVPPGRSWPSRLRVIDVGNDPVALRQRYSDRTRFIVTSGTARLVFKAGSASAPPVLGGAVQDIFPNELYVPTHLQPALRGLARATTGQWWTALDHEPRYEVVVEYGNGLMPRIVEVRTLSR